MLIAKSLSAVIATRVLWASALEVTTEAPGRKTETKGRKETSTLVTIRYGDPDGIVKVIGRATLGGKWSSEQGLKEFKKAPKRFGNPNIQKPADVPQATTDVVIKLGPLHVASAYDVNGVSTEQEALAYFGFRPDHFDQGPHWDDAVALGLCAPRRSLEEAVA